MQDIRLVAVLLHCRKEIKQRREPLLEPPSGTSIPKRGQTRRTTRAASAPPRVVFLGVSPW